MVLKKPKWNISHQENFQLNYHQVSPYKMAQINFNFLNRIEINLIQKLILTEIYFIIVINLLYLK